MQDFMQSLQIRCPVPGHIGLSTATIASAPSGSPAFRSTCISEIFSSSGHPFSSMPSGLTAIFVTVSPRGAGSRRPFEHESLSRS
jgi:hypothetical protein